MAQLERGGGGPVILAPGEPFAQPHPVLVPHGRRGLVAHPPAGRAQPPNEVDVLPHLHILGEALPGGLPADHEGGTGDVRNPRPRPDDAGPAAHVERGTRPLVARQPGAPGLVRQDAGRDRAHRGVGEVRQQGVHPAGTGHAVRVEERHERRVRRRQAGVPGRRGPAVDRPPQYPGRGRGRGVLGRGRVAGAVVHHDDPSRPGQPGEAAGQFGGPVADRDDHRHLVRSWSAGRTGAVKRGIRDPGVEQAAGQHAGLRVVRHRRT